MNLGDDYQGMVMLVVGMMRDIRFAGGLSLWLAWQLIIWFGVTFALVRRAVGVFGGD